MEEPKIFEFTPFRRDKNIITAYNNFMELLPEDGWAVLRDADLMWLDSYYGVQIIKAIEDNPNVGALTITVNRIGNRLNQHYSIYLEDDIIIHRKIAAKIKKKFEGVYLDWNHETGELLNGMVMIVSKKVWKKVRGFKEWLPNYSKILGVDTKFHKDLLANNLDVKVIKGIYAYHWYSGFNEISGRNINHLK